MSLLLQNSINSLSSTASIVGTASNLKKNRSNKNENQSIQTNQHWSQLYPKLHNNDTVSRNESILRHRSWTWLITGGWASDLSHERMFYPLSSFECSQTGLCLCVMSSIPSLRAFTDITLLARNASTSSLHFYISSISLSQIQLCVSFNFMAPPLLSLKALYHLLW